MTRLLAPVLALCLFTGCAKNTTTSTPPAPQQTVVNAARAVADGINLAVSTCVSLNQQGKLNAANTNACKSWATLAAHTLDQVFAELSSSDPWATQKTKILTYLATVTAPAVASGIDPAASAQFTAVATLVKQLIAQVTSL